MASIIVSNVSANPATINPGDTLTLSFDVDGNFGASITATYYLNGANNVVFNTRGGQVKSFADQLALPNPPQTFTKPLTIDTGGSGQATQLFAIYVLVTDTSSQDSAVSHCNVNFK